MRFWNTEESNEYIDFDLLDNRVLDTSSGKIVGDINIQVENRVYEVVHVGKELLVYSLDENGEKEGYFPFVFKAKEE